MNVRCESCQRSIHLSPKAIEKYAGRQFCCPNCGKPVAVPAEAGDEPVLADEPPGPAPPAAETTTAAPASAAAAAEPPAAAKPPAEKPSAPAAEIVIAPPGVPHLDLGPSRPVGGRQRSKTKQHEPQASKTPQSAKRSKTSKKGLWLAIGGGASVLALVVVAVLMFGGRGRTGSTASPDRRLAAGKGAISVTLPADSVRETSLLIDGQKTDVPESGKIRRAVPPGTRQITLQRRGFEQIDVALMVKEGEIVEYSPAWKPLSLPGMASSGSGLPAVWDPSAAGEAPQLTFDDWFQDFDQAKQRAGQQGKDILVLFDGSDWCGYSMRMADEVFFDRRFAEQIAGQYVLVFLDFPRSPGGKAKVQDAERNASWAERFGIEGFPTIIVTDDQGLPFGRMGYVEGGFHGFAQQLGAMQSIRDQRNSLLARVDVETGKAKLQSAQQALALISALNFEPFYVDMFRKWYEASQAADPQNEAGQQEVFFETWWRASLAEIEEDDAQGLAARVQEVSAWGEQHAFVDRELAGRLYLQAAWLSRTQPDVAKQLAEKGLSFEPREENVRGLLSFLKLSAQDLNIVGNGSGFVVAEGGYVLTNRHVATGPGRLVVRWPGVDKPVDARVVAASEDLDLALLQAEVPADAGLRPLRLSDESPARGASVAAFGFPLGERVGKGLKLTTGVVSATDEQTENGMILLDCRINPGNSGGPLCNPRGEVVGVVTARSLASAEVDSYGMAIPGSAASKFLQQALPDYDADRIQSANLPEGQWDAVDRLVSPSVLMIQRIRE
jgi:S1-C subfamily serine protease